MCSPHLIRAVADDDASPAAATAGAPLSVSPETLARLRRVEDLTHALTPDFPLFPIYEPFRARRLFAVEMDGYTAQELTFAEHAGTHVDAPAHFFSDGMTVEGIDAGRLVAPLVVIDLVDRVARDEDALLTADDVRAWERRHGAVPPGAVVALYSGWEARLSEPGRFLNADASGVLHAPGFGREAAELLVHERAVAGLATDTLSLDAGPSTTYEAHRVLLGAGRYGIENVASLGRVPAAGAVVIVGAPKHAGGSGGPARILALY